MHVHEYSQDVTARKRAEQALRESEARLRQVVESLPIVLISQEAGTGRLMMIGAVEEMLGYDRQALVANPELLRGIVDPQDAPLVERAVRDSIAAHRVCEAEFRARHGGDGHTVWIRAQAATIYDEDGNLVRLDPFWSMPPRKKQSPARKPRLEHHLQQPKSSKASPCWPAASPNDFSNLLAVIGGNIEFLRQSLRLEPAQAKALADMDTAARGAGDLTRSPSGPQPPHATQRPHGQRQRRRPRRLPLPPQPHVLRVDSGSPPLTPPARFPPIPTQLQQILSTCA